MLMTMATLHDADFRQLIALREVARERSFGRAAQALGYTQSAVSQQIASLERLLGGPVFDRPGGPKPVELTPLGSLLLTHADALMERLVLAETELRAFARGQHGSLSVGTFQSVSVRLLPQIVREFRPEHLGIDLRLSESDELDELVDQLRDGSLDLSFVVDTPSVDGLEVLPLFDDAFVLVSPRGPDDAPTTLDQLPDLPMVCEFDTSCQRQLEAGLRSVGVPELTNVVFRSSDNSAIQAMVRAGVGHALMPALAIDADDPDVRLQRMDPEIPPRTIGLAWRANRSMSPAATEFVEIARSVGKAMQERQVRLEEVHEELAGQSATAAR
jgi:DNA-binding transcriptional LysR family regulator